MRNLVQAILLFVLCSATFVVDGKTDTRPVGSSEHQLLFVENKGQVMDQYHSRRKDIQFKISATAGLNIFIGKGAIHYQFNKPQSSREAVEALRANPGVSANTTYNMYRMDVELSGCEKDCEVIAEEGQDYYENYIGEIAGGKDIVAHSYRRIVYKEIYPHIDWVLKITNGQLKHEFVVRAGGKVKDIKIKYGGAESLVLNEDGSLTASSPLGNITEQAPKCYDTRGEVKSNFVLDNNVVKYNVANHQGTLTIDPPLIWSAVYGGTHDDNVQAIATDAFWNVYMGGYTTSVAGFATTGAYSTIFTGGFRDAFLMKYNSIGTLQWATYYGSFEYDVAFGVATDPTGNVYLTGSTAAPGAGMSTPSAHQTTFGGGSGDAFLAKFTAAGALTWSTYYGGASGDDATSVTTDASGNVYIAGRSSSTTAIATPGSHQAVQGGSMDSYVAKFNSDGVRQWATYYGGTSDEGWAGVAVDNTGNVFLTASTWSSSAIATPGAHQTTHGGGYTDGFLVKFDNTGTRLWGTYYGGEVEDAASVVAVDASGNAFIGGTTTSTTGISTPGAHQVTIGGMAANDAFIAKFNGSGVRQWGTYKGGAGYESPTGLAIETSGNLVVGGYTSSPTGISTPGSYQPTMAGFSYDAFVAQFTPAGTVLWATYYGPVATSIYYGYGVATDADGSIYLGGVVEDAYDKTMIAKFSTCTVPVPGPLTGGSIVCVGSTITLSAPTTGGTWSASGVHATIGSSTGIVSGVSTGTAYVTYVVANTCAKRQAGQLLTVDSLPAAGTISGLDTVCIGLPITLSGSVLGGTWSASNGNATVSGGIVVGVSMGSVTITHTITNTCGSTEVDKTVEVIICPDGVEELTIPDASLYPNPARDQLVISAAERVLSVSITDLSGREVIRREYDKSEVIINTESLSPGMYLVHVNNRKVYKLIKQ